MVSRMIYLSTLDFNILDKVMKQKPAVHAPKSVWCNPIHFLAYGFGSGAIPVAPGTFGTLAAIPIYLLIQDLPLALYFAVVVIVTLLGIALCHITARDLGVHDHPGIVWDEIAGYLLTMLAAPKGWGWIGLDQQVYRDGSQGTEGAGSHGYGATAKSIG